MAKEDIQPFKFKPGQSGNPAGRPKGIPNSKTRLLRLLELTQDLKNPVTGEIEGFTVMEQIDMMLIQKARKGDLASIRELLNRLEGSPQQAIDHTTNGKDLPTPILGGASSVHTDDGSTEATQAS